MQFHKPLPVARTPDGKKAPALRWGIIGPGWIANRFVSSVQKSTRQQILAVADISLKGAQDFASSHDIPFAYGSVEELVYNKDIDVVYISVPHPAHFTCAMEAIRAGKHVLVEKPLALNGSEVQKLRDAARQNKVFLMEAMWTWFLPKFDVLRQVLEEGMIGEVHSIIADHGEHFGPEHRIMRADLAGGPLMDLGSYPVAFATKILGRPENVLASGQPAPAGVNGQASIILSHANGNQSSIHTTLFSHTPGSAVIAGTEGYIFMEGMFYTPGNFHIFNNDKQKITYEEPRFAYDQLYHEAAHVAYCIEQGLLESPLRPLEDSLVTMQTLDEVRKQLGIVFNEERDGGR
ncbi:Gfo/Idh/MocA family oxidoreductase [Yokenella regensburgei]|uniref:Gfo/Idh/MocA family protein n=1 Tax=Yokenella regensburgei TaxID=158877 RepID=UPI003F17E3EE